MGALLCCFGADRDREEDQFNNSGDRVSLNGYLLRKWEELLRSCTRLLLPADQLIFSSQETEQIYNSAINPLLQASKFLTPRSQIIDGSSHDLSEDKDVCPICLEDYTDQNPLIILQCGHEFHLACIYEWMERSEACPFCGKKMVF